MSERILELLPELKLPVVQKGLTLMQDGLTIAYPKFAKRHRNVLPYHNAANHVVDVTKDALVIAQIDNALSPRKREILAASGAFHDSGYAKRYENNEGFGAEFIGIYMPRFGYSADEIICAQTGIMSTEVKFNPFRQLVADDKISKILADADVAIFGKKEYEAALHNIFFELLLVGEIPADTRQNRLKFYELRLNMLREHDWQTETARCIFDRQKQENIEALERKLEKRHTVVA